MRYRAHVRHGRLVLDEPTNLPEGTEVELITADDDVPAEERAALNAALLEADAEAQRGKGIPIDTFLVEMRRGIPRDR